MELNEFHVAYPTAGTPGHGDTIAGTDVGVTGVEIDLAGPAGGEDDKTSADGFDATGLAIEGVGTTNTGGGVGVGSRLVIADQVDGDVMVEQGQAGLLHGLVDQRGFNRAAGGIGRVDDTPVAVSAFAGEVKGGIAILLLEFAETDTMFEQCLDGCRAVFDHVAHDFGMAQARAGVERVFDMGFEGVLVVEHRGYPALGVEG